MNNPDQLFIYGKTGFRQEEDRFLAATGDIAQFAKRPVHAKVHDFVANFHLARIIVRPQRAIVVIGCYITCMGRKTDHFPG
jgi:hypothetical protein